MQPTRADILAKAKTPPERPVAIEAYWDGDTTGWMVILTLVYIKRSFFRRQHRDYSLGTLRGSGGDIRLFHGSVPPWPEASLAKEIGQEIAGNFGVPFYFASPDYPENECPRWWERDHGQPCRNCGVLLLQPDRCPWRGTCYHCHLDEEREKRQAKWTPEQLAGPRCGLCGNPATHEFNGDPVCLSCHDKYDIYNCVRCGILSRNLNSIDHTTMCLSCDLQVSIESLTDSQRNIIREAMCKGWLEGMQSAMAVMSCSDIKAQIVVNRLGKSSSPESSA